jgi:hypothetical protein
VLAADRRGTSRSSEIASGRNMHKILSISILFLVTQFSCFSDGLDRNLDQQRFADLLAKINPWESGRKEDFKTQDWDRLVVAARTMQKFAPSSVQNVLQEWQTNYAEQVKFNWSNKLYLLFKVMFNLPEHAPAREQFGFGAWIQQKFPGESSINSDGTINLAWPISWNDGKPRLVSGFQGYEGPPYRPAAEFDYLLKHFKYRDLSKYRKQSD